MYRGLSARVGPGHHRQPPGDRRRKTLLEAVRGLGADVTRVGERTVRIDASGLASSAPDPAVASRIRGSFLLAAPLLARRGEAVLPRPGRRSDRPAAHRHPRARAPPARRRDRAGRPGLPLDAPGALQGRRGLPRRGQRDRDRERGDGRRARPWENAPSQRGLRAARPGSLPRAERDGGEGRAASAPTPSRSRAWRRSRPPPTGSGLTTSRSARWSPWPP